MENAKWVSWEIICGEDTDNLFRHRGIVSINKIQSIVTASSKVWLNSANNVNFEFPFACVANAEMVYDALRAIITMKPGNSYSMPNMIYVEAI